MFLSVKYYSHLVGVYMMLDTCLMMMIIVQKDGFIHSKVSSTPCHRNVVINSVFDHVEK